jgi:hypothetical protein
VYAATGSLPAPRYGRWTAVRFAGTPGGYSTSTMQLSLLLIVIGIIVAILVNSAIGIVCILVGLVLLIWPRLTRAA